MNFGLPILFIYPFEHNLRSPWLALTAIPYFFLYGRDLLQLGYRPLDLPRVYALNLMLIPVNLGGILQSIRQLITGRAVAFERTPKVSTETLAPRRYVIAIYVFTAFVFSCAVFGVIDGLRLQPLFDVLNGAFFMYAIVRFRPALRRAGASASDVPLPRPSAARSAGRVVQDESLQSAG